MLLHFALSPWFLKVAVLYGSVHFLSLLLVYPARFLWHLGLKNVWGYRLYPEYYYNRLKAMRPDLRDLEEDALIEHLIPQSAQTFDIVFPEDPIPAPSVAQSFGYVHLPNPHFVLRAQASDPSSHALLSMQVRAVSSPSSEGSLLTYIYTPRALPSRPRYMIFCCDQGGPAERRYREHIDLAHKEGIVVVAFNYSGVFGSSGRVARSIKDLAADVMAQVDYLKRQGVHADEIDINGFSLGGAAAVFAAYQLHLRGDRVGLFCDRTFKSVGDISASTVAYLFFFPKVFEWLFRPFFRLYSWLLGWEVRLDTRFDAIPSQHRFSIGTSVSRKKQFLRGYPRKFHGIFSLLDEEAGDRRMREVGLNDSTALQEKEGAFKRSVRDILQRLEDGCSLGEAQNALHDCVRLSPNLFAYRALHKAYNAENLMTFRQCLEFALLGLKMRKTCGLPGGLNIHTHAAHLKDLPLRVERKKKYSQTMEAFRSFLYGDEELSEQLTGRDALHAFVRQRKLWKDAVEDSMKKFPTQEAHPVVSDFTLYNAVVGGSDIVGLWCLNRYGHINVMNVTYYTLWASLVFLLVVALVRFVRSYQRNMSEDDLEHGLKLEQNVRG